MWSPIKPEQHQRSANGFIDIEFRYRNTISHGKRINDRGSPRPIALIPPPFRLNIASLQRRMPTGPDILGGRRRAMRSVAGADGSPFSPAHRKAEAQSDQRKRDRKTARCASPGGPQLANSE